MQFAICILFWVLVYCERRFVVWVETENVVGKFWTWTFEVGGTEVLENEVAGTGDDVDDVEDGTDDDDVEIVLLENEDEEGNVDGTDNAEDYADEGDNAEEDAYEVVDDVVVFDEVDEDVVDDVDDADAVCMVGKSVIMVMMRDLCSLFWETTVGIHNLLEIE